MMKVKHSFLVFAAAFLMVMPAFAKTGAERSGHCKQGVLAAEMPLCETHEKARLP